MRRIALTFAGVVSLAKGASAQTSPTVVLSPTYQSWQFAKSVPLDSLRIGSASQISVPFLVTLPWGAKTQFSLSGAVFSSTVAVDSGNGGNRSLAGVSDLKARANVQLAGDAFQLTLGVSAPTGKSRLSTAQNDAVRVLAAPALGAAVAVPGNGFGATAGVVSAHNFDSWALALAASYEKRGNYSPVEIVLANRSARTELVPGGAIHASVGVDGLLGTNRASLVVAGDIYSTDEIRAISNDRTASDSYQLGPTATMTASLQFNQPAIRDLVWRVNDRYRSAFKDADGNAVEGSSGNYFDTSLSGAIGVAGRPSLLLGVDASSHTGLPVDRGFVGAKLQAVGITVGMSLPSTRVDWRPSVRAYAGTLQTTRISTSITGLSAGLTIVAR